MLNIRSRCKPTDSEYVAETRHPFSVRHLKISTLTTSGRWGQPDGAPPDFVLIRVNWLFG
jgi:hypothetical protein